MLSRPTNEISDACARRANYLIGYSTRVANRCKAEADRNQIFAGAYISYLAFFERQIEDLFVGLLTSRYEHPSSTVRPVVVMPSTKVAKLLIAGGRSYVDWLPFDQHTKKRAPAFFVNGGPFANLAKTERSALDRASILRNALAHQSDHSLRRFATEFTAGKSLRPSELKPAGYLRGAHSLRRTRFEVQLSELVRVMSSLTS